jgi:kinesin family protein 3/17
MMGVKDQGPEHRGIIPNAFEHIFGFIDQCPISENGKPKMKFLVRCSYLEIYNENICDLLAKQQTQQEKLELKEDPNRGGVYVKDLTCCIVKSIPEIEKLMEYGTVKRKVGETAMNSSSSRSHSIFTIYIETSEDVRILTGYYYPISIRLETERRELRQVS